MQTSTERIRSLLLDLKLPPVDQQCVKHNTLYIDLNTPYTSYKGEYYCKN